MEINMNSENDLNTLSKILQQQGFSIVQGGTWRGHYIHKLRKANQELVLKTPTVI